jgi:diguanylate cyclase (GGDEF)-like protein/PAS domain S-box-containing protein
VSPAPEDYAPEQTITEQETLRLRIAVLAHGLRSFRFLSLVLLPVLAYVNWHDVEKTGWFLSLLGLTLGVQILQLFLHLFSRHNAKHMRITLVSDAIFFTALAYLSGGIFSSYVGMLILVILYSITTMHRLAVYGTGVMVFCCTYLLYLAAVSASHSEVDVFLLMTITIIGVTITAGEILRLINSSKDRTIEFMVAQMRANQELLRHHKIMEQQKERYQQLLESMQGIPWEYNLAERRFSYLGPQVETISGYPLAAWYETGFLYNHVHAEDKSIVSSMFQSSGETGERRDYEYRITTPQNDNIWLLNLTNSIDNTASVVRGIMFDITERKRIDLELKKYQHSLEEMVQQRTEQLKRANEALEKLTLHDPLTGIANRRYFDSKYLEEWNRSLRKHAYLSVMMIDVDRFKDYNDRYGHQAGDECLCRVAAALSGELKRAGDFIARYGGEEFVVVLSDSNPSEGMQVAEKLRAAVERAGITHAGTAAGSVVTVSIGTCTQKVDNELPAEKLLQFADQALYQAKHGGRNRINNYSASLCEYTVT